MNTVYNFLHAYCEERNLPPPSAVDLEHCGKMINYHFKNFWTKNIPFPVGVILQNAGFTVQAHGDTTIVVQFYPESFKPEMAKRCDTYYHKKNNPPAPPVITPVAIEKSHKRKRISTTERKPVFSTNHTK